MGGCAHGKCVSGKCVCDVGWKGPHCTASTCNGRGVWRPGQNCKCIAPFYGPYCGEKLSCLNFNDCSGHGKCHDGQCFCSAGFTGLTCSVLVSTTGRAQE